MYSKLFIKIIFLLKLFHFTKTEDFNPDKVSNLQVTHYDCRNPKDLQQYKITDINDCKDLENEIESTPTIFNVHKKVLPSEI